jgi:protein TonB
VPVDNTPRIIVDEMPEFPGGSLELLRYIGENLEYPAEASDNNIQGRVILKFAVNTDGSVDRVEVIKGVDNSLDNEAIRVVKTLPRFKPGKQNGVAVPVWFTIPVVFQLKTN